MNRLQGLLVGIPLECGAEVPGVVVEVAGSGEKGMPGAMLWPSVVDGVGADNEDQGELAG